MPRVVGVRVGEVARSKAKIACAFILSGSERSDFGGVASKPRDLGGDRGYRVAKFEIAARRDGRAERGPPLQEKKRRRDAGATGTRRCDACGGLGLG
jgi:hypothetical protein